MRAVPFFLCAVTVGSLALAEESPWRRDGAVGDVLVERRSVAGSSFDELQLTTTAKTSLERLCAAVYPKPWSGKLEGRFKHKELLRETDTERWTYEQVSVPVVNDRDYVMHVRLEQAPPGNRCEVSFETESVGVRPPPPGFVRIGAIRGRWSLEDLGETGVRVRYRIFSDPGGGVPAFLAKSGQRSSAVEFMKVILARAQPAATAP